MLKFGGTSVSNLPNWRNIAAVVRERRATGARVLMVHSAVSGITDRLEKLLTAALTGGHDAAAAAIEERAPQLAAELGVGVSPALRAATSPTAASAARGSRRSAGRSAIARAPASWPTAS